MEKRILVVAALGAVLLGMTDAKQAKADVFPVTFEGHQGTTAVVQDYTVNTITLHCTGSFALSSGYTSSTGSGDFSFGSGSGISWVLLGAGNTPDAMDATVLLDSPYTLDETEASWEIFATQVNTNLADAIANGSDLGAHMTGFNLESMSVGAVPEPTSGVLLGSAGVWFLARRRRKSE